MSYLYCRSRAVEGFAQNREADDRALHFLAQTLAERGAYFIALTTDPIYDPLRSDPRFAALVEKVAFVEASAAPRKKRNC